MKHFVLCAWLASAIAGSSSAAVLAPSVLQNPPAATAQTPQDKLDAILKRYEEQSDKAYEAARAAKTTEERAAAQRLRPGKEYVVELRDLAESAHGTDAAAGAWIAIVGIAGRVDAKDDAHNALEVLLADYLKSPKLAELPARLRYASQEAGADVVQGALRKMLDGSPHANVKASALYTLAGIALDDSSRSPEKLAEARKHFERLSKEFGAVETMRKSTYGAVAEQNLFELDHLQVGMVAPDFEAVDENGKPFKLSDYRGKVVIVDFWGFW
jgi:hypothetical protein